MWHEQSWEFSTRRMLRGNLDSLPEPNDYSITTRFNFRWLIGTVHISRVPKPMSGGRIDGLVVEIAFDVNAVGTSVCG